MSFCKKFTAVLTADDLSNNRKLVTRTRCKMWSCEYCAEQNRKIWRARIIGHINAVGGAWSWFTLTAHSKTRGRQLSLANLRQAWDKLMKRMKRKYGAFHYVRVYEQHKDGSYHVHAIASFAFDDLRWRYSKGERTTQYSKWLGQQARDLKLGYYTHAANVPIEAHGGYVASYVTKYIVKLSPQFEAELGRIRHIQASQHWQKHGAETRYDWSLAAGIYLRDVLDAAVTKTPVIDINTGQQITSDEFLDTYVYPPEFAMDARMRAYDAENESPDAGDTG